MVGKYAIKRHLYSLKVLWLRRIDLCLIALAELRLLDLLCDLGLKTCIFRVKLALFGQRPFYPARMKPA